MSLVLFNSFYFLLIDKFSNTETIVSVADLFIPNYAETACNTIQNEICFMFLYSTPVFSPDIKTVSVVFIPRRKAEGI